MLPDQTGGVANGTAFRVFGRGKAVVLIHGVGINKDIWAPQIAALAESYQVIAHHMLGHSDSALPPEGAMLHDYAAQLLNLLPRHRSCRGEGAEIAWQLGMRFDQDEQFVWGCAVDRPAHDLSARHAPGTTMKKP
ncbi:alpha/beta fold hydrolase [Cupriavidus necator]|uniref:alpha/beta fold hydrolase n=1 Tax=Cupriavidus necator TaxID=106590 RepID=UPI0005B53008|nr:hypothetical protein [Cupriavidus necator]